MNSSSEAGLPGLTGFVVNRIMGIIWFGFLFCWFGVFLTEVLFFLVEYLLFKALTTGLLQMESCIAHSSTRSAKFIFTKL